MISNNQIKTYSSLRNKKYRESTRMFLAEGEKIVIDILSAKSRLFKIHSIIASSGFISSLSQTFIREIPEILESSEANLEKISSLSTPNKAILVCELPSYNPDFNDIANGLSLFLDDIRDPGNLGTIMRTADWFGIHHIFCTRESVDVYNPKVVQSTMGAICRVKVYYSETESFLQEIRKLDSYPLIGTVLEGENIYQANLPQKGVIVMGNESKGISPALINKLDYKLTIPKTGSGLETSESLNVATAAAIVMAEFRRREVK